MSDLLDKSPAAREWLDGRVKYYSGGIYGKLAPAVIWTNARDAEGALIVEVEPLELVAKISSEPLILLHNHDPGKPIGQVVECAYFETEDDDCFIVAVVGYYAGGEVLDFHGAGVDPAALAISPAKLRELPDNCWIEIATDPRGSDKAWLDEISADSPLRVERTELSLNAADSVLDLISLGVPFVLLVWNPYITAISTEAGKDTYAAFREWLLTLFEAHANRHNSILDVQSFIDGCQVQFLMRSVRPGKSQAAIENIAPAAAQAHHLVDRLKARGMLAIKVVYEFDQDESIWYPSYAILKDKRIIKGRAALIAIDQLPLGLSLGLSRGKSQSK